MSQQEHNDAKTFLTTILAIFIALKLAKVVDWSWGYVLAPLWGPLALALLVLIIGFFVNLVNRFFDK